MDVIRNRDGKYDGGSELFNTPTTSKTSIMTFKVQYVE